ncbi:hypothetical protein PVAND_013558 [Polypedilum vanderplanki]|uniref:Uncharacterized protein n=1 Tax=Polypedilum vanderplanki TaxID=319348 RepID=A0A9J6CRY4_POLVA|nr:hypothetical protein PVAND_013558 [Polypedilum vanderplanki]
MVVILLLVPSSSSSSLTTTTFTNSISVSQPKYHVLNSSNVSNSVHAHDLPPRTPQSSNYYRCYGSRPLTTHHQSFITTIPATSSTSTSANRNINNHNYSREYVNHVTRINISNDFSQIEASNGDPEAIVKEEEIITKRKTELTTTKQIETRVKRQVKFEDGKVIEDSGPIVSTATTEDTDKVESEQTERKTLGEPSSSTPDALEFNKTAVNDESSQIAEPSTVKKYALAATRDDGLVREEKNNRIVSREDTTELTEIEDVRHYGDFSDEVDNKAEASLLCEKQNYLTRCHSLSHADDADFIAQFDFVNVYILNKRLITINLSYDFDVDFYPLITDRLNVTKRPNMVNASLAPISEHKSKHSQEM